MSLSQSLRRSTRLALLLALAAAMLYAGPALLHAPVASAQICPGGGIVYGASCPGFGTSTGISSPGGPGASGYSTCPDGSVVFPGQSCGIGPSYCPGGAFVALGQPCPANNGLAACPGGGAVPIGQSCNPTITTCPGGLTIRAGQACPSSQTVTCPGGVVVSVTQSCPGNGGYNYNCGNGVQVPLGQPCPNQPGSTVCPTLEVIPPGQQCPGTTSPPTTTTAAPAGPSVTYHAGWNIVAGPAGTAVAGATGSLFTLQAGDTSYETLAAGGPFKPGAGYWAYFPSDATFTLPTAPAGSVTVTLPAGQFVMIGNPGDSPAAVTGADTVLVFDPTTNSYSQASTLAVGQGGWAVSSAGGQVVITNPS